GIRDRTVTGVQTCALPISGPPAPRPRGPALPATLRAALEEQRPAVSVVPAAVPGLRVFARRPGDAGAGPGNEPGRPGATGRGPRSEERRVGKEGGYGVPRQ